MRGSVAGLPDFSVKGANPTHYALLVVLDTLFSAIVISPAVVGYWRSIWELMELYVYPQNSVISAIISTAIGIVGHLVLTVCQHGFSKHFHPDTSRILYYAFSRLYTVCFAFICVNGWRGPWLLLDLYTEMELTTIVLTTCIGVVALTALRALRNISATPFSIVTDQVKGYFEVVTMFRVSIEEKTTLYVLDCLFSVFIIGTLVVFVWRGAWVLVDIYLFPENEYWSAWGSLVLGYTIVAIAFLLQPMMRWICDRISGLLRLLVADVFLFFSFVGTVNVWRGIWNLLNLYFLPENMELSAWITHWVCLILLILLKCSNTLLVRGVYIDADEPAGKCVVFPVYYLRLIFQRERIKKINKKFQIEAMSRRKIELDNIKIDCSCGTDLKNHITKENAQNHSPSQ
ncbi:uncharacterized protein LOC116164911 isoform X3 [Photinus pyralis]|uniref:Uncharacterized protein n=1 Tax=Photinus pyralis TaxID=7054 RepID=A0A1Y1NG96_PHOPY|nr:uncharacterized protein LOC116164911 isoform X3 [Photinus pyralis]